MPNFISEDQIEQALLQRLQHLCGFDVLDCHTADPADLNDGSGRADKREVLVTGETQVGERLSKPYAVAVHRGRIYVSDTVSRFVRVFDVPAGQQHKIGDEEGEGQLPKPVGLDVDAAGNLYVADIGAKAVMVGGRSTFGKLTR